MSIANFLEIGVKLQKNPRLTQENLETNMENSCTYCCIRNYPISCNKCGIKENHKEVMLKRFGIIVD